LGSPRQDDGSVPIEAGIRSRAKMEPAPWSEDIVAPVAVSLRRDTGNRNDGGPTTQATQGTRLFSKLADR